MSNKANWTVGRIGPRMKAKARAKLPPVCVGCGATVGLTIDHVVARAHGGTNHISNLQMLCWECNFGKGLGEQK